VDRKIVEVGRAFRLSRLMLARRILLPAILPDTIVALRSGLGLGFMFVVAAEIMGASEGLGYLLLSATSQINTPLAFASLFALAILGILAYLAVVLIERLLAPLLPPTTRH
jgi:sulfonate transport system permease protein